MKKVVLLASIMLFCLAGIMNAQENRKEQREARREAARKKMEAEKALEAIQDSIAFEKAYEALKAGTFVLEADYIMFPTGILVM